MKPPLSEKPRHETDRRALAIAQADDFSSYIPTHDSPLRWHNVLPLHWLLGALGIAGLCRYVFSIGLTPLLLASICIALPVGLYALWRAGQIAGQAFESRFVVPRRISHTQVIVDASLLPIYRRWVTILFLSLELIAVAIVLLWITG